MVPKEVKKFYLSGSIKKGDEDLRTSDFFWTSEDEQYLLQNCKFGTELLHPARPRIDRQDEINNLGCDLYMVKISDAVLVDFRRRKGIGVGAELMLADQLGIPVIGWVAEDSHYRKPDMKNVSGQDLKDWTHPFVLGLCDRLCHNLESVVRTLNTAAEKDSISAIYSEKSKAAIAHFIARNPDLSELL